ncbi:hypothetical protein K9O30_18435 [Clostridium bowmanii]|uniref:hypothetical protein n=1 Tax=Clostridium bowmanii TaxID=132925 RepID=UPI001C0E2613|nr:hypothetical protein [Clostridium bowmanii]MBU3191217.1 hypothetical protein [Clostridium bowmanii]MCA1075665.1 hypothetical protein [Clostridium bowmanii]
MNEAKRTSTETSTPFLVRIKYRQNTSWQGTIQWLDGKKTRHFRSCLELMMLIEGALLISDAGNGKRIEFHTWDDKGGNE